MNANLLSLAIWVPIAAGLLYPFVGLTLSPMIAAATTPNTRLPVFKTT